MQLFEPGQIIAILLVLAVCLASAYIYLRWTIVWNDSQADLTGKTVIVTGANVGEILFLLIVHFLLNM